MLRKQMLAWKSMNKFLFQKVVYDVKYVWSYFVCSHLKEFERIIPEKLICSSEVESAI